MKYTTMELIEKILDLIKQEKGIDFAKYKINTIFRRIRQRALILNFSSLEKYYAFLKKNSAQEVDILVNYLLINTSEFFRDPLYFYYFEQLAKDMINKGNKFMKVLSIGCAAGEEVYSIAMLLNEQKKKYPDFDFFIQGIDYDQDVLEDAEKGIYLRESLKNVPICFFEKYFTLYKERYKFNTSFFKGKISFEKKNVLEIDCLKTRGIFFYDFIFIRNILIYFNPKEIEKLFYKLIHLISDNGIIVLGCSEIVTDKFLHYFDLVCAGVKIYRFKFKKA
ncbi:MAG: CheR family methyltransferase [Desulfonauticus sp.]|nr:CheR family methyltransferase [Desulfonauticus sp.]